MRWVDDLYMIMSIKHILRCCKRVSAPGWFWDNVEDDALGGVLPMGGKTCLCCDLGGVFLNEVVTWRVFYDYALWWSLNIAWKLS